LQICPCLATFALNAMALASASCVLCVIAMLQAPVSTRGDNAHDEVVAGNPSAQLSLRGSPRNQSIATPLGQGQSWPGYQALTSDCVEQKYDDKCRSCMCRSGSTRWCNTACDPAGDDRENSCCQPFKQNGETCSQDWECGPGTGRVIDGETMHGNCRTTSGESCSWPNLWGCHCVIY
jgi:hypothetical protein